MLIKEANATVNGVTFGFVRRRYGRKTFTWLFYRKPENLSGWQSYNGDPWPSVVVPKRDLIRIASELTGECNTPSLDGWAK